MIPMPRLDGRAEPAAARSLTIDGKKVQVKRVSVDADPKGKAVPRLTTIYDAAKQAGIDIPILCHREHMKPVAVCRVCSVQVDFEGRPAEWRLAPACYRPAEANMIVNTHHSNERVRILGQDADRAAPGRPPRALRKHKAHGDCELEVLAGKLQLTQVRVPRSPERGRKMIRRW